MRTWRGWFACGVAAALSGCAELDSWTSSGDVEPASARTSEVESATVWELTLMAGRYGVMLDQARTILRLPEPAAPRDAFPTDTAGEAAERKALAAQQVLVAREFFADAARACARRRTPAQVRTMACRYKGGVPAPLREQASLDVAALQARNDALDRIIMPWWSATCATQPKRRGDEPVCPME